MKEAVFDFPLLPASGRASHFVPLALHLLASVLHLQQACALIMYVYRYCLYRSQAVQLEADDNGLGVKRKSQAVENYW